MTRTKAAAGVLLLLLAVGGAVWFAVGGDGAGTRSAARDGDALHAAQFDRACGAAYAGAAGVYRASGRVAGE